MWDTAPLEFSQPLWCSSADKRDKFLSTCLTWSLPPIRFLVFPWMDGYRFGPIHAFCCHGGRMMRAGDKEIKVPQRLKTSIYTHTMWNISIQSHKQHDPLSDGKCRLANLKKIQIFFFAEFKSIRAIFTTEVNMIFQNARFKRNLIFLFLTSKSMPFCYVSFYFVFSFFSSIISPGEYKPPTQTTPE